MSARCSSLLAALLFLAPSCAQHDNSADVARELAAGAVPAAAAASAASKKGFNPRLLRRFGPARATIADVEPSPAKVELGRMLYHEKRLSKSQELSCNSCHQLDRYGVDSEVTSKGHNGRRGDRNAPTVYHAAGHFEQFWDGRAATIEDQALGPLLNPSEMAAPNEKYVVDVLGSMPAYLKAFEQAFPGEKHPITLVNVGRAIGAFERKLTTRARWDDYLEGQSSALTDKEIEGLKLFTNLGCMVCHTGEFLGGSMYEKVGAVEPWPGQKDQGRYDVTRRDGDRMMFKVPSLRNISETAPYFHDGSAATLEQAVEMMGRHQLGLELDSAEVDAIVTWLKSLKGDLPKSYIALPELPASTASTPKPDHS
ncbi:MAG TPA: cytochrome c peroxidase [Polyangiaceae bacterium]|nr:cytochrome c peroxidase [Polyangiaceae bacterium]